MKIALIQTEKSYLSEAKNTYTFLVDKNASKQAVAAAVKEIFKVSPTSVRTLIRNGKATRFSRGKRAYPGTTYREDRKIAYVTLKKGEQIKLEEETEAKVEEPKKEAKKAKTETKKGAK